ncbi:MAG: TonB-dependent receptor plug domain-containing protein [Gemmatimonadota bacterium]|nr:TonB-dependent receptor plug domain-containing protein [Gemmatimonadota bacterium]
MTTYAKGGFMRFSRPGRFGFGSSGATAMLLACVLASVGCDRAESPFAPDFGVEEPSRLSVPAEQTSVEQPISSVQTGDGSPGEAEVIRLREPTSISTECRSIPPLVVIDGVVQPEDFPISDVKALDIAHVEIVKGVAATILYGPRGENGVIEIQTKRGKKATLLNGLKPR